MKNKFKGIIFDLDGTLLDTIHSLTLSMNNVLQSMNYQTHPVDKYKIFVGNGMRKLVQRALPANISNDETILNSALKKFQIEYNNNWQYKTAPYSGIKELLDSLAKTDIKIAILSNKPHEFTLKTVSHFLNDWKFDNIIGARDNIPVKPDPISAFEIAENWNLPTKEIIFVGDTSVDIETAKAAGMYSIAVRWGFRPLELEEFKPDKIIEKPKEISSILHAQN